MIRDDFNGADMRQTVSSSIQNKVEVNPIVGGIVTLVIGGFYLWDTSFLFGEGAVLTLTYIIIAIAILCMAGLLFGTQFVPYLQDREDVVDDFVFVYMAPVVFGLMAFNLLAGIFTMDAFSGWLKFFLLFAIGIGWFLFKFPSPYLWMIAFLYLMVLGFIAKVNINQGRPLGKKIAVAWDYGKQVVGGAWSAWFGDSDDDTSDGTTGSAATPKEKVEKAAESAKETAANVKKKVVGAKDVVVAKVDTIKDIFGEGAESTKERAEELFGDKKSSSKAKKSSSSRPSKKVDELQKLKEKM